MITIVNYGLGNLGSIKNMFRKIGYESIITSDVGIISKAEKIILPGVGSYDKGISKITELGLRDILNEKALIEKVPVLGICLGMQLMAESSDEGTMPGLGWIPAKVMKFSFEDNENKVPHMGWNEVNVTNDNELIHKSDEEIRYYFVHSYYAKVNDKSYSFLTTNYGIEFDSGIFKDNIYGVQFHPEKSHRYGMRLLKNFANI